jgi:hypothetical protein
MRRISPAEPQAQPLLLPALESLADHLTEGIEYGELEARLSQAVVAVINGPTTSFPKPSQPRTLWLLETT